MKVNPATYIQQIEFCQAHRSNSGGKRLCPKEKRNGAGTTAQAQAQNPKLEFNPLFY